MSDERRPPAHYNPPPKFELRRAIEFATYPAWQSVAALSGDRLINIRALVDAIFNASAKDTP